MKRGIETSSPWRFASTKWPELVDQDQRHEADAELPAPDQRVGSDRDEQAEELEGEDAELDRQAQHDCDRAPELLGQAASSPAPGGSARSRGSQARAQAWAAEPIPQQASEASAPAGRREGEVGVLQRVERRVLDRDVRAEEWDEARDRDVEPLPLGLDEVAELVDEDQRDEADAELPAPDQRVRADRDEQAEELEDEEAELDDQAEHDRDRAPRSFTRRSSARLRVDRLVVAKIGLELRLGVSWLTALTIATGLEQEVAREARTAARPRPAGRSNYLEDTNAALVTGERRLGLCPFLCSKEESRLSPRLAATVLGLQTGKSR